MLKNKIQALAQAQAQQFNEFRQHLHRHPELSFQEQNTAAYIRQQLASFGIADIQPIADTGTVALLHGQKEGPSRCIALRADIDALPIKEANKADYCSQNEGVMHACGHDAHTACLLGAAKILKQLENEWSGTIKLIFQPGEEQDPGGASILVAAGVLHNPAPALILGLHCDPDMPLGRVGFCAGPAMAATDEVYIDVHGKGGHAARPHQCIDTILIASQIVCALQQVVSRRADPLSPSVLSFGKIYSDGGATNVIPDTVHIWGTFRSFDEAWRYKAHEIIQQIATQTAAAMGGSCTVNIPKGYPSVFNHHKLTQQIQGFTSDYGLDAPNIPQRMGGEDFAFYSQEIPACFYRIGTQVAGGTGLHTPNFDIHPEAVPMYAGLVAFLATQALHADL